MYFINHYHLATRQNDVIRCKFQACRNLNYYTPMSNCSNWYSALFEWWTDKILFCIENFGKVV